MSNTRARKPVTPKPSGLRAALANRKTRTETYALVQVESAVLDEAVRKVDEALSRAAVADFQDDAEAKTSTAKVLADARAELAACSYSVTFRGLTPAEFDALVNEHPPTDEQAKAGDTWNEDFIFALAEACCIDDEKLTADEWKSEVDSFSRADYGKFTRTVLTVNARESSHGIPKG